MKKTNKQIYFNGKWRRIYIKDNIEYIRYNGEYIAINEI